MEDLLEAVGRDVRYAWRGLRRSPGVTAVAVASLALGIGANTAIFSLINTIMLRLLPVRDPGRLVELLFKAPRQDHFNLFSWRSFDHYQKNNHVFSGVIAFGFEPFAVRGGGLEPETARGLWVSENYFPVLGVRAGLGRLIGPEDGKAGSPANVVVVSWSYWESRFHLDPGVVGRRIAINGMPATIIGVTPREFLGLELGSKWDLWLPLAMEPMLHRSSNIGTRRYWLKLAARLKPGVSIEQARAEMGVLFRWTQEDEFQASNDASEFQWKAEVQPAGSGLSRVRDQYGKPALLLMGVVALLLLIACTNLASVLLARGSARRREMAVRVSLGAGRLRLFRQALTESVLLAAAGGLLGWFLAYGGTGVLARIIASGQVPMDLPAKPDRFVLLFTAAVSLLTGVLFGLAPAWQAFDTSAASPLRETPGSGETRARRWFGRSLVAAQVAFSMVLLTGAGLFVSHLARLEGMDLGFRRDHVLLVPLDATNSGYDNAHLSRAYQELLGRLETIPGVRSASSCAFYPESGVGAMRTANVEGYQARPGERRHLSQSWVAPKYFETLGMPLLLGRDFDFQDRGRPRVAIVNQTLVRYFFPDGQPLGKHITFDGDEQPYEIVGVVGDIRSTDTRQPSQRMVYFNMFQGPRAYANFALRTSVDPDAVAGPVRRMVGASLKTVEVGRIRTMAEHVDSAIVPQRLIALLSGVFGALGAALAALGLYGLLAYTVARRAREIGIRVALGATRRNITRLVLGEALGMVCAGLLMGAPLAYWGQRLAASWIPGLPPGSGLPMIAGALGMAGLALIAAYLPARRAVRVDPVEALRYE